MLYSDLIENEVFIHVKVVFFYQIKYVMKTINVKFKIRFTPKLHRNPCFIRTQIIKGKVFFAPGLSLNNLETADHM